MERIRDLQLKIYADKAGRYRARVIAGNGRQLARTSRGYDSLAGTEQNPGIMADMTTMTMMAHDPDLYGDKSGEWRWRWRNTEGKIVMISSEGHEDRSHCEEMGNLVLDATVVEQAETG